MHTSLTASVSLYNPVMAGLVPAIHVDGLRRAFGVFRLCGPPDVDGRDKPGHDGFSKV